MPRERFRVIWSARVQETYNLFARLPRRTAQRLGNGQAQGNTFLPLALRFEEDEEPVFASFNGGFIEVAAHDLDAKVIELPRQLFRDPEAKTHIWVECIPMPFTAEKVHVDPLTYRDWGLLEAWSSQLEDLLLQQVSIVYPGQTLVLHVNHGITACVQVKRSGFQALASPWEDETLLQNRLHCLCLKSNTSVIVSPITRPSSDRDACLLLLPCLQDYNASMEQFAKFLNVDVVNVPLFSAAIHPETLRMILGCQYSRHLMECNGFLQYDAEKHQTRKETAIVRVIPSELVSKNAIAVHPLIRLKLHAQVLIDHVLIRILEESDIKLVNIETLNTGRLSLCPVHITGNSTLSPWRRPDIISGFDRTPTLSENANVFIPSDLQRCFIDSGSYVTLPLTESHTCGRTLFRVDCTDCHSVLPVDCLERLVGNDFRAKRDPEIIRHDLDVSLIDTIPDISIIDEGLAESITMSLGLHGFVIYGQNGSGKTHLALMHATVSHLREGRGTIYLDCRKLRETKDLSLQNLLQEIVQVFKDATSLPSCTVILDDLDQIVLSVETTSDSNESSRMQQINPATVQHSKLISDTLFHAIKYARTKLKGQVCVIATCDSPHSIPSEIFKLIGDENAVLVPQLSAHNRVNLFVKILQSRSIHVCPSGRLSVSRITEEYRARDIRNLALRVAKKLECALPNALTEFGEILNEEITNYVPMSQISALVERVDLSSSWTEIGGLFRAKQALFETIIRPSIYPRIYANSKVRQPSGILLFGPPGAGKTCIVPALAKKCGYRLVTCRGPELLDKYIGASEANVRNLFARAASVAPSILFLDELDALAPRRGSDNTGVTDRIVNQLLTFLDGVEDVSANKVYVVAATSRPDKVDPALLRPGRLERHIYLGYPSLHEAEDIISKIALRYTLTNETSEIIQDGSLVRQLTGTAFSRLSPADLKGAFDRANVDAIRQSLTEGKDSEAIQISADKVVKALASCQPSLSEGEIERLLSCYASFRGLEKRGSDGLVEMPGSDGSHLRAALK